MAGYDSTTLPFKMDATSVKLTDGKSGTPNELDLTLLQGSKITYASPGRKIANVKHGDRFLATPTKVYTGDQMITGQIVFLVASFKGASAFTPYEFMKGTITDFKSTANGGVPAMHIDVTYDNTEDDSAGVTQTGRIAHASFTNMAFDPAGTDGLGTITADFEATVAGSEVTYT